MPAALHPGAVRRLTRERINVRLSAVQNAQLALLVVLTGMPAAALIRQGIELVINKYAKEVTHDA